MPPRRGFFWWGGQSIFYPNVAPLVLKMKPRSANLCLIFVQLCGIAFCKNVTPRSG